MRRGRWFLGTRVEPNGFSKEGESIRAFAVNSGVLLETKTFGIVQFTLSYTKAFRP